MKIDISAEDFGTLCVCALRYCHGRQTYMPWLVRDIIGGHLQELTNETIQAMNNDCLFLRETGHYGDPEVDKPGWIQWETRIHDELRRRKEEEK